MRSKKICDWHQIFIQLWYSIVGGIIGAAIVILVTPYRHGFMRVVSTEGVAGLIATVCGLLAALLGISIAVVFAIQWAFLEDKVQGALELEMVVFQKEIRKNINSAIHGMGAYLQAWLRPGLNDDEVDQRVKIALKHWPEIPNAAAYTSRYFCFETKTRRGGLFGEPIPPEQIERLICLAEYWADEAFKAKGTHDPGHPEYAKARTIALRKEPMSVMDYLEKAFKQSDNFRSDVLEQQVEWDVLTGMTHGDKDIKLLDELLDMLGLKRPTEEEVKAHCENRDSWQRASFDVVLRENGDSSTILVEGICLLPNDNTIQWTIIPSNSKSMSEYRKECPDSSEVVKYIFKKYIPTRIKEHPIYPSFGTGSTLKNNTGDG